MTAKQRLLKWERRVRAMDSFDVPSHYEVYRDLNKYSRFTGFLKQWISWLLTDKGEDNPYREIFDKRDDVPKDWWDIAMKVGQGKDIVNTIPTVTNTEVDSKERNRVFKTFLPAYRALTESFEKRSVFQWIFNHSQYTAERDSIRALRGLMMSLTNCTAEDVEAKLQDYKKELPDSGRDAIERDEDGEEYRDSKLTALKIMIYEEKEAAKSNLSVEEWRKKNDREVKIRERRFNLERDKDYYYSDSMIDDIIAQEFPEDDDNVIENEEKKEPVILNHTDIEGNANNNDINKDLFNDAIVSEESPEFQAFLQETNNNNNAKVK